MTQEIKLTYFEDLQLKAFEKDGPITFNEIVSLLQDTHQTLAQCGPLDPASSFLYNRRAELISIGEIKHKLLPKSEQEWVFRVWPTTLYYASKRLNDAVQKNKQFIKELCQMLNGDLYTCGLHSQPTLFCDIPLDRHEEFLSYIQDEVDAKMMRYEMLSKKIATRYSALIWKSKR